jgi:hypothetical protein
MYNVVIYNMYIAVIEQKVQASFLGQLGQGYDDGRAQARSDYAAGIRNAVCPMNTLQQISYCAAYGSGYNDAWDGLKTANEP